MRDLVVHQGPALTPPLPSRTPLLPLPALLPCAHPLPQLYTEMMELGVQENVVSMTALLKALGGAPGMAQECVRLFKRMQHGPARCAVEGGGGRVKGLVGWLVCFLSSMHVEHLHLHSLQSSICHVTSAVCLQGAPQPGHLPHRDLGAAGAGRAGRGVAPVPAHAPPLPRGQQRVRGPHGGGRWGCK